MPGTFNVTRGMLEFWIDPESPYYKPRFGEDKKFVFFCAGGLRSALAAKTAQDMGLKPVAHVVGGFKAWKEAGGPVEPGEGEEGRGEEVAFASHDLVHELPEPRAAQLRRRRWPWIQAQGPGTVRSTRLRGTEDHAQDQDVHFSLVGRVQGQRGGHAGAGGGSGGQARRGGRRRAGQAARAPHRARQAAAAGSRAAADRSGLAVPGAVAAGGATTSTPRTSTARASSPAWGACRGASA